MNGKKAKAIRKAARLAVKQELVERRLSGESADRILNSPAANGYIDMGAVKSRLSGEHHASMVILNNRSPKKVARLIRRSDKRSAANA